MNGTKIAIVIPTFNEVENLPELIKSLEEILPRDELRLIVVDDNSPDGTGHGFAISMARTGNPYENAMMESFFKTLKYEEVYLSEYETYDDVILRLPHFIEEVYNRKRLHSALRYLPPEDYEKLLPKYDNQEEPRQTLLTLSVQR